MSQAHELRVLFYRKASALQDGGPWNIFTKALSSFTQLEERELESFDNSMLARSEWDHIFLDYDLAQPEILQKLKIPNLTLVRKNSCPWNDLKAREEMLPLLQTFPCLILEGLPAPDLLRIIHLYLLPKQKAGVAALMEKGALILGEKVQSLDGTGILLDRLASYLEQVDGFELKSKIPDLRQLISAALTEGFRRSKQSNSPYPTLDFQTSAASSKIVFNLRFPAGNIDLTALPNTILNALDLTWHLLWQASDVLIMTHHSQFKEIEIHALISAAESRSSAQFKTLLWKTLDRSNAKETLLTSPEKYSFHLISNLKIKSAADYLKNIQIGEDSSGLDLSNLPEIAIRKISDMEIRLAQLSEKEIKKTELLKKSMAKIHHLTGDLTKTKSEIDRLMKSEQQKRSMLQRMIDGLQEKVESLSTPIEEIKEKGSDSDNSSKLTTDLRVSENEKNSLQQKLIQEQKRASSLELKYQAAYSEIGARDKEIQDLKSTILKIKREQTSHSKIEQTFNKVPDPATKIKELEKQEYLLKIELKKAQLREESIDKTLKLFQIRTKQTEQKLQAAKASELELTKKVEELSTALRKASKAA